MNTHNLMKSWRDVKKFDFRDCRMPLRIPLKHKTKIVIKTPKIPRSFKTLPDFEKSIVMEHFMDKLQMLLDKSDVIRRFKQQEFLTGLEQQGYDKELKDKMKTLDDNLKKYNIPKTEATALKSKLLKEIMLKEKSTKMNSYIVPVNTSKTPVNELGEAVRRDYDKEMFHIDFDDLESYLGENLDEAEAEIGLPLPLEFKATQANELMNTLTKGSSVEKRWEKVIENSPSLKKLVRTPAENMKLAILYGRWISIRKIFQISSRRRMESEAEVEAMFSEDRLTEMWDILTNLEPEELRRVLSPLSGTTEVIKQRNNVLSTLRETIERSFNLGGGGDEPIRPLLFGDE